MNRIKELVQEATEPEVTQIAVIAAQAKRDEYLRGDDHPQHDITIEDVRYVLKAVDQLAGKAEDEQPVSNCCGVPLPDWPDSDFCPNCLEHCCVDSEHE